MVIQLFSEERISQEWFPVLFILVTFFLSKQIKKILETKIDVELIWSNSYQVVFSVYFQVNLLTFIRLPTRVNRKTPIHFWTNCLSRVRDVTRWFPEQHGQIWFSWCYTCLIRGKIYICTFFTNCFKTVHWVSNRIYASFGFQRVCIWVETCTLCYHSSFSHVLIIPVCLAMPFCNTWYDH